VLYSNLQVFVFHSRENMQEAVGDMQSDQIIIRRSLACNTDYLYITTVLPMYTFPTLHC
jgi:hypothetical protein